MKKRNNLYDLDLLFFHRGTNFDIQKKQFFEELLNCFIKIVALLVLFYLFDFIGKHYKFNTDYLYSVFFIPLFLSLKDYKQMFNSCFAEAIVKDSYISVKHGFLYVKYDKLYLKDLNNIELYRSLCGKFFGYSTLELYAFGGYVCLPYLKNTKNNFKLIKKLMEQTQDNQKRSADAE